MESLQTIEEMLTERLNESLSSKFKPISEYKDKKSLLNEIYKNTHKDYKGGGRKFEEKSILLGRSGKTTMVYLTELTDDEIINKVYFQPSKEEHATALEQLKKLK